MKKFLIFALLFLVVFLLSCGPYSIELHSVSGIDNFSIDNSSVGLTIYFLPKDFMELFPYIDGDYDYREELVSGFGYETALLYMVYDETTYYKAKDYALKNLKTVDNSEEEYEGYTFLMRDLGETALKGSRVYLAYSDEDQTLLVLGTHRTRVSDYKDNSLKEYIEINFPFYDFEEGKINRTE